MSSAKQAQSILGKYYAERFKFELTGKNPPNIKDALKNLKGLGKDAISKHTDNASHEFNTSSEAKKLLSDKTKEAAHQAGFFMKYFDIITNPLTTPEEKTLVRENLLRLLMTDTGAPPSAFVDAYIGQVDEIAEEYLLENSADSVPKISPVAPPPIEPNHLTGD